MIDLQISTTCSQDLRLPCQRLTLTARTGAQGVVWHAWMLFDLDATLETPGIRAALAFELCRLAQAIEERRI